MIYSPDNHPITYELRINSSTRTFSTHLQPNSIFYPDVSHGLYKREGDTLTICYHPGELC